MYPLVSVLIPCYNAQKWLETAIHSALGQSWPKVEIIIVDDGSTDASLEIARSFSCDQVNVISQENRGASSARNTALKAAQGDFIQYLDADDFLAPHKIRDQIQILDQSPPQVLAICGTMHFFDGEDPSRGIFHDGMPFYQDSDDPLDWLITLMGGDGEGGMVQPAAWLVPRCVIDQAGPWNEQLALDDDGEYFARVILASAGIRRSPSALTYYRKFRSLQSLSGHQTPQNLRSGLDALNLRAEYILSRTQSNRAIRAITRNYMILAVAAYPFCPAVTEAALDRVQELGGSDYFPPLGGARIQRLQQLVGWKLARRLSVALHQLHLRRMRKSWATA
ncbi:glycosyltransferase family 2 protein [Lyngbya confervoides]|uniref:Glycosyltransferase family 2 protein n=1 Tax=Lyngbya confervoides BDU141951 TaxID=1574623 RepID=A0ABD4SZI1_9CYAN|nr:glycosyltransferase [Lyngbya confervoides]MCM1981755.1 glycosyltransferase family 2 protein [Lyngbya confervoides BDU141951]